MKLQCLASLVALALLPGQVVAHCKFASSKFLDPIPYSFDDLDTFPSLIVNGKVTSQWVNVRRTNNYNTRSPVTDVTSPDFRCYDTQTDAAHTATTIQVQAGSQLGIMSDGTIYHPGVSVLDQSRTWQRLLSG